MILSSSIVQIGTFGDEFQDRGRFFMEIRFRTTRTLSEGSKVEVYRVISAKRSIIEIIREKYESYENRFIIIIILFNALYPFG